MNRWPAAAMISANSRSGPSIYFLRGPFWVSGAAARVPTSSAVRHRLSLRRNARHCGTTQDLNGVAPLAAWHYGASAAGATAVC
jgi:hypothetical protein